MKRLAIFIPILAVFILTAVLGGGPRSALSDAARYLWFAGNLTEGYYTPESRINLWSGPGYPLVLVPATAAEDPYMAGAAINVGLMLGALFYFYYTARRYVGHRYAVAATYVLGLWPPALKMIPLLMTELLSIFLACGFAFHLSSAHREGGKRTLHLIAAAAFLAYLALTRVIFGYVIPIALAVILIYYLATRRRAFRRDLLVCCLALAFCSPYLFYTYSVTGRIYYWANSGGLSLYWMSSPYRGELGDWHHMRAGQDRQDVAKEHSEFFSQLGGLSPVETDEALKQKAIENIKAHPGKYARNWVANLGRLLFGYPRTRPVTGLRTLLDVVPGMFFTVVAALCTYPTFAGRRNIPHEIWMLVLVGFIYLAESSLVSALPRFMLPVMPFGFLWIFLVLTRVMRIHVKR